MGCYNVGKNGLFFVNFMLLLIPSVYADAKASLGGFDFMSLLPMALIFVVFYFLIFRPQQKKNKSHSEMLKNLKRGDTIFTSSGIIGKIERLGETDIILESANKTQIRLLKSIIQGIYDAKGNPTSDNFSGGKSSSNEEFSKEKALPSNNKGYMSKKRPPQRPKNIAKEENSSEPNNTTNT